MAVGLVLLSSWVPAQSVREPSLCHRLCYLLAVCLPEGCVFEVGDYEDPMDTEQLVFEEREVAALSVSSGSASEAAGAPESSLVMVRL